MKKPLEGPETAVTLTARSALGTSSAEQSIRRLPVHPIESVEVAFIADDGGAMLKGKSRQMSVIDEVSAGTDFGQQPGKDVDVARANFGFRLRR